MVPVRPIGKSLILSTTRLLRQSLSSLKIGEQTAVVVATQEPFHRAALSAALPWIRPTAPAEATLGERQGTGLLQRIKPALLVVDDVECNLARSAVQLGIAVALAGERPGELEAIAPAKKWIADSYPAGTGLLLQTTGTTGEPKLVGLSRGNLEASIAGIVETLALGPEDRTATLMPLTHIHGMVAVLLAGIASGGQVMPVAPRDPRALWRQIDEVSPTWLSMVPTLLQALLETAPSQKPDALQGLRFLRTSSSALPVSLRRRAEDYFEVPVVEAYGMTEACHQMASARPDDSLPGSVGRANPAVQIAVMTPTGEALPEGESGEVCVKGDSVMAGYLWPADANETAFHDAWFRTGDLGRLDTDGRLWLTGRIKEQINRGGESLAPSEIEEVLLSHPDITEAVAFPLPHPTLGEEVAALCVRAVERSITEHDVILFAAERLSFAHAPKTIFFADSIPRQASSGKVSRLAIASLYRSEREGRSKTERRGNPWIAKLRRHLTDVLGHGDFDDETSVFAVGANSLHIVQLLSRLEAEEGVVLPMARLLTHQSVAALAGLLADQGQSSWDAEQSEKMPAGAISFPASPAIAGLISAERLYPNPLRNRAALLVRVRQAFTVDDIVDAWASVVRSQPALRASVVPDVEAGAVVRVGAEPNSPQLRMLEVTATAEELEGAWDAVPEITAFLAPDDGGAPGSSFVRAAILVTPAREHFLLCQIHEALADGYGQSLLPALIEAALLRRPLPDPGPLTAIMGARPAGEASEAPKRMPSEQLHEDGTGRRMQRSETTERLLKAALWKAFDKKAREQATTRFAMSATLFALLLNGLAGSATPVWCASQRRRDARDFATLGNASALMPFALQADAGEQVATLARRVMTQLFAAIERGGHALPAFDEPLYIFEIASEALELQAIRPDLTLGEGVRSYRRLRSNVPVASLELSINPPIGEGDGSIELTFDTGRFSSARASSLLDAYCDLLDAVAAKPDAKAGELVLAADYDSLAEHPVPEGTEIGALADEPRDFVALYDAILRRWPDEPAAVWREGSITFAELDAAADRFSRLLLKEGARPGEILAFRMSANAPAAARVLFLVAQLAVFRLRSVLLPLGPMLPAARVREEIERLGVRFVLSSKLDLDSAPDWAGPDCTLEIPDFEGTVLLRHPADPAVSLDLPDDAAVLMTTSGSTGVAKTIIDNQKMLLGFIEGMVKSAVVPAVPSLMMANIGVDACFSDCWVAWVFGRWTVLLETERRTPDELRSAAALGAKAVTLTPTVAAAALRDDPHCFDGYAFLLMGGEPVPSGLVQELSEAAPDLIALNPYGTTEAAVLATFWRCTQSDGSSVPAGLAIPGYRVVIADPKGLRPLPKHWTGEILLCCPGPALGYLDPDLTRERFVELARWPGERFFRTADLGWIDDGGQLRYVGRIDRQTKVTGFRIELDEIERVVQEVAGVAEAGAFVIKRKGQERVEVVVEPRKNPADDALRKQIVLNCREWLPRAAVPARIVFIEAMPLGDSGKKSHKALRSLLDETASAGKKRERPLTEKDLPRPGTTEAKLAALWTRQFRNHGHDPGPMTASSDVIDLGATSLDMLRMGARIEKTFDISFPDEQIYLQPTLSAQAALIDRLQNKGSRPSSAKSRTSGELVELVREGSDPDQPWPVVIAVPGARGRSSFLGPIGTHSFPQAALYRVDVHLPDAGDGDPGPVSQLIERLAEEIVSKNLAERCILVGYSFGGWLAWLTDRLLIDRGHGQRPLINLDGGAMHLRNPKLQEPIDRLLPNGSTSTPSRMLLVHRAEPKKVAIGNLAVREWINMEEVSLSFIPVPTIDHGDVRLADLLQAISPRFRAFAEAFPEDGVAGPCSYPLGTLGFALFEMLAAETPPSPQEIHRVLDTLADKPIGKNLRSTFLLLGLASGDFMTAQVLADRVVDEDPAFRQGVYAKIALLLACGRKEEASHLAERWSRDNPDDNVMRKRLGAAPSRKMSWQEIPRVTKLTFKLIDSIAASLPL